MIDAPETVTALLADLFPIHGERFELQLVEFTRFGWGEGLHGTLRVLFFDLHGLPEQIRETELRLLRSDDLGVDTAVVRSALVAWRARIAALSRALFEEIDPSPWAEVDAEEHERRYAAWLAEIDPETPEAADRRRQAALAEAREVFPRLAAHVRAVHGLVLPQTLAVYHAFHLAIRELPPEVRSASCTHPGGILDRLAPGGWELRVPNGLDERVHDRFRADPPEMLTVAWGESDGLHFGLWFEDAERTGPVVLNYARDSAETWICGDHPLSVCRHRWQYDPPAEDATGFADRRYLDELAWFEARERAVAGPVVDLSVRRPLLGGPGVDPDPGLPLDPERRAEAYRNDPRTVRGWIARAQTSLSSGRSSLALALGRELHWFDGAPYREEAGALLLAAYRALGREAHAGILEAHLQLRDLPSVDVLQRAEDYTGLPEAP